MQLETHHHTARMSVYLKLLSNGVCILYVQIAAIRDIRIYPQDSPARSKFDMFSYLKMYLSLCTHIYAQKISNGLEISENNWRKNL